MHAVLAVGANTHSQSEGKRKSYCARIHITHDTPTTRMNDSDGIAVRQSADAAHVV